MKIMVCDDEPMLREYVVTLLEDDGHHVETSVNGQEAWKKFRRIPVHLMC